MRPLLIVALLLSCITIAAQHNRHIVKKKPVAVKIISPLSRYSAEWNKPKYLVCNTAKTALYMTAEEKNVIYILNMIRINPKFFAQNVLARYPDSSEQGWLINIDEYKSLMDTLLKMEPVNILQPDKKCFTSALCHALSTGPIGAVTHDRNNPDCLEKKYFHGECIDFGYSDALNIVLHLMIDEGVPSLGHRNICLSSYKSLGVSIRPHSHYEHMAVLDFHY